ncbi:TPA: DNA-directed RNA polymerase subunit delta [Streptococcus pneumoniae]
MKLEVFAGQEKSELSMIEVARAILELRGRDHEMHFSDLVNEIQNYLGTSNSDIREALPLFYTELNFDGSFISLGDNKWGLRSWYGVDEIDEEIIALEENDDDEVTPKAKKKRVNAFMDGDSDAIDYNADDPEDEDAYEADPALSYDDAYEADPALSYDDENPDDEKNEVEAYDAEINEIAPDDLGEDVDLNEDDDEFSDDDAETSEE